MSLRNRRCLAATAFALLVQSAAGAERLRAQEPDTVPADTQAVAKPESAAADTAAADTTANFPLFPEPASQHPGLTSRWDHAYLIGSGVLDLGGLLEYTAPLVAVRAGYYQGPQASVFSAAGPASFRFDIEGYQYVPLFGGALDWHQPGFVEYDQVDLIRDAGGYELAGQLYRRDRPDAYSRIEGGTGDPSHNFVRAFFSSEFLDGPFAFGFDRVNAQPRPGVGFGRRTAILASLAHVLLGGVWGQIDYRRSVIERDSFPSPTRDDWVVRLRRPFEGGWYVDLVAGTGRQEEDPFPPTPGAMDTVPGPSLRADQIALRGARVSEHWRAIVSHRVWDGSGMPNFESEASLELSLGPAYVFARGRYTDWPSFNAAGGFAAVSLRLPLGFRAVAEAEEGDQGLISARPVERISYTRWTLGGELTQLGWTVGARGGRWRVDPSPGIGLPFDSAVAVPGGTVDVFEARAGGPLFKLFNGSFGLGGRYLRREAGTFLYWPQDEWYLEASYDVLLLGGQLEILLHGRGGIRGSMLVADRTQEPQILVSNQDLDWFWSEVRVRIKDVHIFITYEVFDAEGGPRDVPAYPLPTSIFLFGLKWEFWN